jgi:UDP-2,4-diacetamido-2,4,6-trideoxy-beta-L-altropyranose hydrolase
MLFRADASPSIGAGHVMRCLAFAETARWAGWSSTFVVNPEAVDIVPELNNDYVALRVIDGEDASASLSTIDVVVVDNYRLDRDSEKVYATDGAKVVVFDDLADRSHAADILIDPTPHRREDEYAQLVPDGCCILSGPQYAMVRQAWRKLRRETCARHATDHPVRRILISMSATDPNNLSSKVIAALTTSGLNVKTDVVLGRGAPHRRAVEGALGDGMTLHVDPPDFPELVAAADLVIGAPGSSSFERAVLGMPSILIPFADNQRKVGEGLAAGGNAEVLASEILDEPVALGTKIFALAADGLRRAAMSRSVAALTDGRGPLRLLAALAGEVPVAKGSGLKLRLAEQSDCDWLLELQRQPATRKFSRNTLPPTSEQHAAWFDDILQDLRRLLLIAEIRGSAIGFVRLDKITDEPPTFEISIAIDERCQGRGYGAAALKLARRLAPATELLATVFPGNSASRALFAAAGYAQESEDSFRCRPS